METLTDTFSNLPGFSTETGEVDQETAKLFSDSNIRANFMRKVFSLVAAQLVVTTLIAAFIYYFETTFVGMLNTTGWWPVYLNMAIGFFAYLAIILSTTCRYFHKILKKN